MHQIDPSSASKADLSAFKLTAWTSDPRAIPKVVWLHVAENKSFVTAGKQLLFGSLQPSLGCKNVLTYRVTVHICSITDFVPADLSPPPPPPTTDNGDSGQDGNPDRHHFQGGTSPRLQGYRCQRGVVDGEVGTRKSGGGVGAMKAPLVENRPLILGQNGL